MTPDLFGCRVARASRSGVASVEKVLIMSTIVGMILFSTTVLGKFWNYSDLLKHALTSEIVTASPTSVSHSNLPGQVASGSKLDSNPSSIVYWQVGAGVAAIGTFVTAMILTRERRRKKVVTPPATTDTPKPKPFSEPKLAPGNVFSKRHLTMAILLNQLGENAFSEMKIGHLVSSKVTTILPTLPLEEVRNMFLLNHFRHLFVCDETGNLFGIISARDLQRASTGTAQDVMSTEITIASPDLSVSPAITLMMDKRISCLPVVDGERLLGIVTTTDLLIALQCTLQILQTMTCTRTSELPAV